MNHGLIGQLIGWNPMITAPRDGTRIVVKTKDAIHHDCHFADGGGDDQPRYCGWFIPAGTGNGNGFRGIDDPVGWRPIKEESGG